MEMRYALVMLCWLAMTAGCTLKEEPKREYPKRTLTESDRRYLRQRGIPNPESQEARRALWERDFAREEVEKARRRHHERFGRK